MKIYLKAIHSLITTIILVAVVISIALLAITWIYGVLYTSIKSSDKIQIFQDVIFVKNNTQAILNVTVRNLGATTIQFQKACIKGIPSCETTYFLSPKSRSLESGANTTLSVVFNATDCVDKLKNNVQYTIIVILSSGEMYPIEAVMRQD
ncbi:MAG: hypothetical protein QXE68_03695 [Sulfolobales archaeon]